MMLRKTARGTEGDGGGEIGMTRGIRADGGELKRLVGVQP